ncbi:MAG: DUF3187 family protein, partial [Bdellovibrionales bacterium]|nr:DUF3187 family protein [Bdellovibrionales bacterium]
MRQRFSLVLFFLLCVFLPPGLSAQENSTPNWGYGPVEIFNHYPLSAVHASWTETSPEVLEEGQAQVRTSYSWGSTYATNQSYRIDAETRELRFEVDYGLTSRLEIGMDVPLFWRGGGVL